MLNDYLSKFTGFHLASQHHLKTIFGNFPSTSFHRILQGRIRGHEYHRSLSKWLLKLIFYRITTHFYYSTSFIRNETRLIMKRAQGTITRFCYNKRGMLCSTGKIIRIRVERIPRKELRCEITRSDSIDNLLSTSLKIYTGCTSKNHNWVAFKSMFIKAIDILIICSRHGSPLEISRTF